jgi:hypothetical protein
LRRSLIALATVVAGALSIGVGSATAATHTVTVTGSDVSPSGYWSRADTRPPGTGTFVAGPATPPRGQGSFELNTPLGPVEKPGAAKVQLLTTLFNGLPLRYVDGVGYSTFRHPESTGFIAGVAALNIRVDLDGDGTTDAYMVYEPYQDLGNGAVLSGVWQDWDAYRAGAARWWISGNKSPTCTQATPCAWSTIMQLHPNATIREGTDFRGSFGVNQGSNNPGVISNADALYLSAFRQKLVFDFEPGSGRSDHGDGG